MRDRAPMLFLCFAVAFDLAGCVTTLSQTTAKQTCPPPKQYTAAQEKQVAAELRTLPTDSETSHWITDYIAERDILKACQAH